MGSLRLREVPESRGAIVRSSLFAVKKVLFVSLINVTTELDSIKGAVSRIADKKCSALQFTSVDSIWFLIQNQRNFISRYGPFE